MPMIKDWNTFRDMALELVSDGFVPVFGEFCPELEEIVCDCILLAKKKGQKNVTLLINSNGGQNDSLTAIRSSMYQSEIEYTGFVMSRARSNGFRLLQTCKRRVAHSNALLVFHWGHYMLDNSELSAIVKGHSWVAQHIQNVHLTSLEEVNERTGVPIETLIEFATLQRTFTAREALEIGFIDEVVYDIPVSYQAVKEHLDG